MVDRNITLLEHLLEQERVALIAGDFATLQGLAPEKDRLLQGLPSYNLSPANLGDISRRIERNQALLNASMKGIKAAEMRITGRKGSTAGSIIYGRNGEVSHMTSGAKGLSQKL